MRQLGGFLGRLFGPLLKSGLPLITNVIKLFVKSVLILLGLTAAAAAAVTEIHQNVLGSGNTTLIISNNKMEDIMKIVKSLGDLGLLIKQVIETIQNKIKEQKGGFVCY